MAAARYPSLPRLAEAYRAARKRAVPCTSPPRPTEAYRVPNGLAVPLLSRCQPIRPGGGGRGENRRYRGFSSSKRVAPALGGARHLPRRLSRLLFVEGGGTCSCWRAPISAHPFRYAAASRVTRSEARF